MFLFWPNTTYHHHFSSHLHLIWVRVATSEMYTRYCFGMLLLPSNGSYLCFRGFTIFISYMKSSQPILQLRYFGEESLIHLVAIHWSNSSIADSYVSTSCREKLIEVSEEFCQEKLVSEPTRQRNILDLCFTSHSSAVISSQTSPGLSDNETCCQIYCLPKKSSRKVYLYNKASWDEIRSNLLHVSEISGAYQDFTKGVLNSADPCTVQTQIDYLAKQLATNASSSI